MALQLQTEIFFLSSEEYLEFFAVFKNFTNSWYIIHFTISGGTCLVNTVLNNICVRNAQVERERDVFVYFSG